ncbi:MAG: succinate dehydrogenase cytochrome b subunit [Mangrovibacterium sp.]
MSNFCSSSIGRKFFMSITGLFLMVFLLMHMSINLFIIFDKSGELYNEAVHFMSTNPLIKIMEPVLALGFIVHIIWGFIIELKNMKARPAKYTERKAAGSCISRNMFILGAMVLVFIGLHMFQFLVPVKTAHFGGDETFSAFHMVVSTFQQPVFACLYVLAAILVSLHITHGFWSAFQTIGFSNKQWERRLKCFASIYAVIIALGFCIIPIMVLLTF